MLDLSKAKAPEAVKVDGVFYAIKTDFRNWINFSRILGSDNPLFSNFDFIYETSIPDNQQAGFDALMEFFENKKELPRIIGDSSDIRVLDYTLDAELIFSAFMEQYGIDLFDEKLHLHWWKFLALLSGLHGTKLNEVMAYRCFDENAKTDWKQTQILNRKRWELPRQLTAAEKKAEEDFDRLLGEKKD